jgi:hypothetical protein
MFRFALVLLLSMTFAEPTAVLAQARGAQTAPQTAPQTPSQTPQRGQRAAAKPPTLLTLRQVLESLFTLKNSTRVEDMISKAGGVQFRATPDNVDILKQFGASQKLISMIPAPPPPPAPPQPPAPKLAGPLTIVCEPKDCVVAVDDRYEGSTDHNRKTVNGLHPGDVTVQIFADGYDHLTRRIPLQEGKPAEEKFLLQPSTLVRQNNGKTAVLSAVVSLGGIDGLTDLGDMDADGTVQWTDSDGKVQQWTVTFNRRPGRNLSATFKTADGQCTASIQPQATKEDCRGGLRNGGDKIAKQATSLFLSYQIQDVLRTLLQRPLIASDTDENSVESFIKDDSYVLKVDHDGFPTDLTYRIGDDQPIQVRYANYMNVNKGRFPREISVGRPNNPPAWVFTIKNVHSRITRGQ